MNKWGNFGILKTASIPQLVLVNQLTRYLSIKSKNSLCPLYFINSNNK